MALERREIKKTALEGPDERKSVITAVIDLLDEGDNLLLLGHSHPDEDCIASMVSFALISVKMHKRVMIFLPGKIQEGFSYLLAICRYNSIGIASSADEIPDDIELIAVLDTPKPGMIEGYDKLLPVFDKAASVIEIDHHLASDARYIGDEIYSLVDSASSTCELIGLLAIELEKRDDLITKYQINELFTRNLVLSLITGIISDTRMGKYLKSDEERWFYNWISGLFDRMLTYKTRSGSGNMASKEEVFSAISALSSKEESCYHFFLEHFKSKPFVDYAVLNDSDSAEMYEQYGADIFVSVAKTIADTLAEKSSHLGLVAYYDHSEGSELVQFRLRRSHLFQDLDLRDFLKENGIENGGGHPGAIGFRFNRKEIDDITAFAEALVDKAAAMAVSAMAK